MKINLPETALEALGAAGVSTMDDARALGIGGIARLPGNISEDDLRKIAVALVEDANQTADRLANLPPQADEAPEAPIDAVDDATDDPDDDVAPITEAETTPPGEEFTVRLQIRHAEWLRDTAELHNDTAGHIIEQLVRRGCAEDPFKAGRRGGGTVQASEFDGGEE